MFLVYPAIFYAAEEGGYIVEFPDLDGIVTQGDGEAEAFEMAEDALGTWLYEAYIAGEGYPKASALKDIKPEALEDTVSPEDTMRDASRIINKRQLRHLPVLDKAGRPVGLITRNNVVHGLFQEFLDNPDAECVEGGQDDDF